MVIKDYILISWYMMFLIQVKQVIVVIPGCKVVM
jgi:hypothetical protein